MKTFETRVISYTKELHGVDFVGFADFYIDGPLRYAMNVRLAGAATDIEHVLRRSYGYHGSWLTKALKRA